MSATTVAGTPATYSLRNVFDLYRHLWHHARGKRLALLAAMLLLVSAQCVLLAIPYFAGRAINTLQAEGTNGFAEAGMWLSLLVVATAGSWVVHGPGRILERNVSIAVRRDITRDLMRRLTQLPLSWHEANHSGATAHRVQQSSHALSVFAQSQFIYLNSVVRLAGPIVALWLLEPIVALVAVVGFVTVCASVAWFDRAMLRLARRENDAERRFSSALLDSLGNATSLLALRQARALMRLLEERLETVFVPLRRSILLNEAKWCTVDVATRVLSSVLVALFAWRAIGTSEAGVQHALMLGSLYMVWEYASQAGGVISAFASHFQALARQSADYASADPIRQAAVPIGGDCRPRVVRWDRCELRELTFRHPGARDASPTLSHCALSLQRGRRYALIGASGSGKSTLLRVLAGLYEAQRISIDPRDGTAVVSPAEASRFLRASTTLIPQDAEVFEGSLADNLAVSETLHGPVQSADYTRALELARVVDFIGIDALDVEIAERAANWSGGQRARIALARGVLAARDSTLVLLDEPTASLDARTEAAVYENLFAQFADACIVSAVHRLNVLERFDEVIVMSHGRIVAQGAPATLVSAEYAQLLAAYRKEAASSATVPSEVA